MIRRGSDYIKSLEEGNHAEVYYEGKKVENLVEHPAFKIPIRTVADYYDLHWKEDSLRVYNPDVGQETSITFF
ncbi:MAG: 4-hydroxyphenylacetate 3-hydroxylase, partial [Candidatus Aramenus sulfurataquae]